MDTSSDNQVSPSDPESTRHPSGQEGAIEAEAALLIGIQNGPSDGTVAQGSNYGDSFDLPDDLDDTVVTGSALTGVTDGPTGGVVANGAADTPQADPVVAGDGEAASLEDAEKPREPSREKDEEATNPAEIEDEAEEEEREEGDATLENGKDPRESSEEEADKADGQIGEEDPAQDESSLEANANLVNSMNPLNGAGEEEEERVVDPVEIKDEAQAYPIEGEEREAVNPNEENGEEEEEDVDPVGIKDEAQVDSIEGEEREAANLYDENGEEVEEVVDPADPIEGEEREAANPDDENGEEEEEEEGEIDPVGVEDEAPPGRGKIPVSARKSDGSHRPHGLAKPTEAEAALLMAMLNGEENGNDDGTEDDDDVVIVSSDDDDDEDDEGDEDEDEEEDEEDGAETASREGTVELSSDEEKEADEDEEVVDGDEDGGEEKDGDEMVERAVNQPAITIRYRVQSNAPAHSIAALKRPNEEPEGLPALRVYHLITMDANFALPPVGEICKNLEIPVRTFVPVIPTVRISSQLPVIGVRKYLKEGDPRFLDTQVSVTEHAIDSFVSTGVLKGSIHFMMPKKWKHKTARVCLYYYFCSSDEKEWRRSEIVTMRTVGPKRADKIRFTLSIDLDGTYGPGAGENADSIFFQERLILVAMLGNEGKLRRSEETLITFVKDGNPIKKARLNDAPEPADCIDLDD